jgi:hypothetical protein
MAISLFKFEIHGLMKLSGMDRSDSSPEWTDRMKHKLKHVPQVLEYYLLRHVFLFFSW